MKMGMSVCKCALGSLAGIEAGCTWAPVINVCSVSNLLPSVAVRVIAFCNVSVWSYSKRHAVSEVVSVEFRQQGCEELHSAVDTHSGTQGREELHSA